MFLPIHNYAENLNKAAKISLSALKHLSDLTKDITDTAILILGSKLNFNRQTLFTLVNYFHCL